MRHPIATVGIVAALAIAASPAPGFAKPKDRGMNQGEDQAIYCQREHPGDELACCARGHSRNQKRSCCRKGVGEDFACVGGAENEIWEKKGFESLDECISTAEIHHSTCAEIIGNRGMERGEDQARECRGEPDSLACCARARERNVRRFCCREGGQLNTNGETICVGGEENEIWEESGFESLKDCDDRAIINQIQCMD